VHRGLVYLDTAQDDVYGLAANLAARVSGLAPPRALVVSAAIEPPVRDAFELRPRPASPVKGLKGLVGYHVVVGDPTWLNLVRIVGADLDERCSQVVG
jgi:class 3 adenylate cyclase